MSGSPWGEKRGRKENLRKKNKTWEKVLIVRIVLRSLGEKKTKTSDRERQKYFNGIPEHVIECSNSFDESSSLEKAVCSKSRCCCFAFIVEKKKR